MDPLAPLTITLVVFWIILLPFLVPLPPQFLQFSVKVERLLGSNFYFAYLVVITLCFLLRFGMLWESYEKLGIQDIPEFQAQKIQAQEIQAQEISERENGKPVVVIKVGVIGDDNVGKSSFIGKYVDGSYEPQTVTLGIKFMEAKRTLGNRHLTIRMLELGGRQEFMRSLPHVCSSVDAILIMFDLTNERTLDSVETWYRSARKRNKTAIAFLIGTKFDQFSTQCAEIQAHICAKARRSSRSMHSPLIFCSASDGINIKRTFKLILIKTLRLKSKIVEEHKVGQPLFETNNSK